MVRKFKIFALAGALLMAGSPAFAQDPLSDMMKGMGDMDPMRMLTGEPAAAPAAAPAKKRMMRGRMMKKKMMGKKTVMKKPMMKKGMMKKKM